MSINKPEILEYPIFFKPNRVWRLYKGGAVLDKQALGKQGKDGFYPEEWIASTTVAQNGEHQQSEYDGLSVVDDGSEKRVFLQTLLEEYPEQMLGICDYDSQGLGILCKFIDSAIRLPIQCHPDVSFAKKYCNSNHGKTEMWIVLGTRYIDQVAPYVYVGFKPGIDKEKFKAAVYSQDIDFITRSMHKYEVKESDMYFIPGRLPHAIGSGVLILEVQEPTDLVVQPEKWLGDVELSEEDMWKGLEPEVGLECFDFENVFDRDQTLKKYSLNSRLIKQTDGLEYYDIVSSDITDYFKVQKLIISSDNCFKPDMSWYIAVVAKGSGRVQYGEKTFELREGMYFFVPAKLEQIKYCPDFDMEIYLISK